MPAIEKPNRCTARDAFATALDIKDAIANGDEHGHHVHAPAARAVRDLLITDLAAQFSEEMAPNKERLRAIFDRKVRFVVEIDARYKKQW
jgi:hypothetical protein